MYACLNIEGSIVIVSARQLPKYLPILNWGWWYAYLDHMQRGGMTALDATSNVQCFIADGIASGLFGSFGFLFWPVCDWSPPQVTEVGMGQPNFLWTLFEVLYISFAISIKCSASSQIKPPGTEPAPARTHVTLVVCAYLLKQTLD